MKKCGNTKKGTNKKKRYGNKRKTSFASMSVNWRLYSWVQIYISAYLSLQNQWSSEVDGKCGVCGDPYNADVKENEDIGGKYVNGVITGSYISGSTMDVKVRITAYHMGWFEFR